MSRKRIFLFAVISLLHPVLCLSCGEPGVDHDYVTEVTMDPPLNMMEPSTSLLGMMVELKCRVNPQSSSSSPLQWSSSVTSRGSKLQWSEGGVTVTGTERRNLIHNPSAAEVVLQISNFSSVDYGVYRCECVNDFSYPQFKICGDPFGLPTHCAAASERFYLLPPGRNVQPLEVPISIPGQNVSLETCSSGWIRVNSNGSQEKMASGNVSVSSPQDRAKFICSTGNVLKIVYITIEGYQPLRILHPTSDSADIRFNNDPRTPLCATFTSFPNSTTTDLFLTIVSGSDEMKLDNTTVSIERHRQCRWITEYSSWNDDVMELQNKYPDAVFRCVITSPWENLSINFTLAENFTNQQQECPEADPIMSSSAIVSPSLTGPPTPSLSTPTTLSSPPALPSSAYDVVASPSLSLDAVVITSSQFFSPLPTSFEGRDSSVAIIAGAVVGAVVIILSVVTIITVMEVKRRHRRNLPRRMYKLPDTNGTFNPDLTSGLHTQLSLIDTHANLSDLLSNPSQQITHNGVPVSRQMAKCISGLQQSPWLFPYEKLEFQEELGSGAFGVVNKALAHSLQPGASATTVAVKMLKDDALLDSEEEKDIISELKVLQHVGAHPNIVCLLGASLSDGKLYVIVEFCSNGNLLMFLRSKRNDHQSPLTVRSSVDMAAQVATGMEFLASKNCIHRDLAARNVLITEDFVLKVADFGLARKVYESVYRPSGGKVPVKWLAPESIIDHVSTTQSDVWSFGIVLWEILTLGRTPYPGKSAETVLRDIEAGYRMPRPPSCPLQIYDVMMTCWQLNPTNRPTPTELVKLLEEILTAEEPALNRHYYNMDISGGTQQLEVSADSTHCSCEDLDSFYQCHSCGNAFTTDRVVSQDPEKIFCNDCSQMPEYLSRSSLDLLSSCDELGTLGRRARWARRLHSNDSGVKVSSAENSGDYQVTLGPEATAFARKLAESLQSMCSECKSELEPPEKTVEWNKSNQSMSSVCTTCRAQLEGHQYRNVVSPATADYGSREREEYMRRRVEYVRVLSDDARPVSIGGSQLLLQIGPVEEESSQDDSSDITDITDKEKERPDEEDMTEEEEERSEEEGDRVQLVNGFHRGSGKIELEQKFSNDSGIKLMFEPPPSKRLSAPPVAGRDSLYFSPLTPRLLLSPSLRTSSSSTPGRLSAHPRNRVLFDELGFEETDL